MPPLYRILSSSNMNNPKDSDSSQSIYVPIDAIAML